MRTAGRALLTLLLIVTGLSSSADASSSRQALWIQKYGTGLYGTNIAYHLAVSPDGRRAYVTGESQKYGGSPDIVTIAYEADAGSQLWLSRYDGPGHAIDFPTAIGTSPDGTTLYVAGWVGSVGGGSDFGTIAYDSATGGELWTRLFNGPAGSFDNVSALAVNPIKPIVYVTGPSVTDGLGNSDYLTFAYDAATGDILWQRYLHGAPVTDDFPTDIAVTHDGSTVYVTGASRKPEYECATVAYDATTGHSEWVKRIHSRYPETNGCVDVDVAPDDSRVYLAGGIGADNPDFLTLALSPADGLGRVAAAMGCSGARGGPGRGRRLERGRHHVLHDGSERRPRDRRGLRPPGIRRRHRGQEVGRAVRRPGEWGRPADGRGYQLRHRERLRHGSGEGRG